MNVKLSHTTMFFVIVLSIIGGIELKSQDMERNLCLKTVIIDAGHGGKDAGGVSRNKKFKEKDFVLDIALKLGKKIKEAHPGVKVVYTRSKDVYVTLNERAKIANDNNGDLFISIHTNANNSTKPFGASVHILGQSRDPKRDLYKSNMDVCKRENAVILLEEDSSAEYQGYDPDSPESFIFFQLMQNSHYENSILFATYVDEELSKTKIKRSAYSGIRQDPFLLLWKTAMPSVLLELGFISNDEDLKVLASESGRNDIASRLLTAFSSFKEVYDNSLTSYETENHQVADKKKNDKVIQMVQKPYYSIQVFGLTKKLQAGDSAFKGLDVVPLRSAGSNVYKYVTGRYDSKEKAKSALSSVRKKFPDAFIVYVEGENVKMIK